MWRLSWRLLTFAAMVRSAPSGATRPGMGRGDAIATPVRHGVLLRESMCDSQKIIKWRKINEVKGEKR